MSEAQQEPLDPEKTTMELRAAARSLQASAAKLARLMKEYDGTPDEPGPGKRFDWAVKVRKVKLHRDAKAMGQRPDGEDARQAIAEVEIRETDPSLAAEHDRLVTEMEALKQFISAQKQVISGHQSVLSASKALAGLVA